MKAIVLDLDGTLTNDAKEITPRTLNALLAAQAQGLRVILASGRPTYGISAIAEQLQIGRYGGYVLAFNGGRVTEWGSEPRVVFDQTLDPALVPPLYQAAKDSGCEILTYQGEGIAATCVRDKYVLHEAFINKMPVTLYDDFARQVQYPINKCLIVGEAAYSSRAVFGIGLQGTAQCIPFGGVLFGMCSAGNRQGSESWAFDRESRHQT